MKSTIKRWTLIVLGWFLIVFGLFFGWVPGLPGIIPILIGLMILSGEYVWAHNLIQRLRRTFPTLSMKMDQAQEWARTKLRRLSRRAE